MKLFLSSWQIPDTQVFSEFVGKDLSEITLGLIFNAKDYKSTEERAQKLAETFEYFNGIGIHVEEINLLDYIDKPNELLAKFKEFDVLWFKGGNTYCLRAAIAKSKSEEVIQEAIDSGVVYAGDSAGAILAGATLKYYDLIDDPKLASEILYDALQFVDIAPVPHWASGDFDEALVEVEKKLKEDNYKTIRLTDNEYLLVEDGEITKR